MDRKKYFFSGRFGDVSNSDTDDDTFGGDSISNFLDKIPDQQQTVDENNQITDHNEQNIEKNNQTYGRSNQTEDSSNQPKDQRNPKDKSSKLNDKIDSAVLVFGQFLNPFQISDSFIKKPAPPLNSIAERIKILLYNEKDISNAMKNFFKLRYRRKENSLDSFEYFILLFLCRHYPNANEDTISRFHYLFWGGHAMTLLLRNLTEIQKQDPYIFIHAFAASMADLEKNCIDVEFSTDEILSVGLLQDTFNLWKKSVNDDKRKNDEVEPLDTPNRIDVNNTNIEKLEEVGSFLRQDSFRINTLAKLTSPEIEFDIILKSTVIGDRDRDIDINLSTIPNFQIDKDHEILSLLMLKNDLCFYIENLQTCPIYVNGYKICQNQITYVLDQSFIEFGNISFIFSINNALFYKLSKSIEFIQ